MPVVITTAASSTCFLYAFPLKVCILTHNPISKPDKLLCETNPAHAKSWDFGSVSAGWSTGRPADLANGFSRFWRWASHLLHELHTAGVCRSVVQGQLCLFSILQRDHTDTAAQHSNINGAARGTRVPSPPAATPPTATPTQIKQNHGHPECCTYPTHIKLLSFI